MSVGGLQPHPDSERLRRRLGRCVPLAVPWSAAVYRATGIEYANREDLISGLGSRLHGARWTPRGGFAAVYGSLTAEAALLETLETGAAYGIPLDKRMPLVMVAVDVVLHAVVDLTAGRVRQRSRLSQRTMLEEDWEALQSQGREARTQAIARLAVELGLEGLIVPSARLKGQRNLVVFPEKLRPGSSLTIQNKEKLPRAR